MVLWAKIQNGRHNISVNHSFPHISINIAPKCMNIVQKHMLDIKSIGNMCGLALIDRNVSMCR